MAEVLHHFYPKIVELHNYVGASSASKKKDNWITLNRKVFYKLGLSLPDWMIESLCQSKKGAAEAVNISFVHKFRYVNC